MAVVGLEETFYITYEGEGAVLVCAIVYMPDNTVSCHIAFEFSVYLSNAEFTAGTSGPLYSIYNSHCQGHPWIMDKFWILPLCSLLVKEEAVWLSRLWMMMCWVIQCFSGKKRTG